VLPIFLFRIGIPDGAFRGGADRKATEGSVIPYAIAFAAAYIYMTLHNPAMDHRVTTTLARFGLAYVFVYYYVFVYVGCSVAMWLILAISRGAAGARATARRFPDPGHRGGLDGRELSRPDTVSSGLFGTP